MMEEMTLREVVDSVKTLLISNGSLPLYTTIAAGLFLLALLYSYLNAEPAAIQYNVPYPPEAEPGWKGEVLSDPKIKDPTTSTILSYCPATAQRLPSTQPSSRADIDRAVSAASAAQQQWQHTSFAERRHVLRTLLSHILAHQTAIARVASRDSGKPLTDASFGEILVTAAKLQWTVAHGEAALRPSARPTSLLMAYKRNEVRFAPIGVVAACVSWNYPFHNFLGPVISSIFAGNGIVVKPSERTAWSSGCFLEVVRGALRACGHDERLVQCVLAWPDTAGWLTAHEGVGHVTFIGSRNVAKEVLKDAARSVTPVCAELGGKDPCIVLEDVRDLEGTVAIVMRGCFQSAGQNCIGIERVVVQKGLYGRVVDMLEAGVKGLRLGAALDEEGVDVGAMVSKDGFGFLEEIIQEAVKDGAKLVVGGKRWRHPKYPAAHYFEPTLLVDVTPSMRIAQEELFAPVCLVMKADSVDHAIEIANSTEYALGASVFGKNKANLEKVVNNVKSGMVSVNDFAVYYAVQLPFGGIGGSGYGRFAGEEGLRSVCNMKSVCTDRFPSLINTKIPGPHQYPIKDMSKAWTVAEGVVYLGYGSIVEKVKGIWSIITNM